MTFLESEALKQWEEQLSAYRFPRWNELPEIDLYMDQVVSYIGQKLAFFHAAKENEGGEENRYITATMINNYVKQKLIAPPVKKRYERAQVSELFILFCVKQVLSIGQCGDFLKICRNGGETPQVLYDRFCSVFESVLHRTASHMLPAAAEEDGSAPVMAACAAAFANKLYAEKLIEIALPPKQASEKNA